MSTTKFSTIVLTAALLSSQAIAATNPAALVKIGKNEIIDLLNDPDSAKFKHMSLTESLTDGTKTLCGSYNAKNKAGGYGEFSLFFVTMTANGKPTKVWTEQTRQESDFYDIDREIARRLDRAEIGEIGAINERRDARLARTAQILAEIKEAEARCTASPGKVKVIQKLQ
jgi:hypothetical protein